MTISTRTLSLGLGAAAASSLVMFVAAPAHAASFVPVGTSFEKNGINVTFLGNECITSTCVDLGSKYEDVVGGKVFYGDDIPLALTPGHDTSPEAKAEVKSYTATASGAPGNRDVRNNNMDKDIVVSGLGGAFEIYWGSVDSHNILEFFNGGTSLGKITGSDIAYYFAGLTEPKVKAQGNFLFDAYVTFNGEFDRVVLSTDKLGDGQHRGNGISFEVATAKATAVPEPTAVLSLLAVGAIAGGSAFKQKK